MPDTTNPSQALNIVSIENLINTSTARLNELSRELFDHKEMLASLLDNDLEYREAKMASDKTAKETKAVRAKFVRQPEPAKVQEKIRDYQIQMKELKNALSDYLTQYVTLSGNKQIETPDGALMEIVYNAKLVKKKA